ncbi:MAG: sensor histidine kinase [Myxococcota bacterium]
MEAAGAVRPAARCAGIVVAAGAGAAAVGAAAGGWALAGEASAVFVDSLGGLMAVLVPLAGAVAWLAARDAVNDLRHVAAEVDGVVRDQAWERGVRMRSLDEAGEAARRVDRLRRHYVALLEREREARRRAEAADRDKTEFLRSVSHELRNPLNAVVGFTDVLLAEIDGPLNAAQREDLRIIRGSGAHLVHLFNDVLDMSAAASGHLRIDRGPVPIGPILEAVGAELRGQRRDRPVAIRVEVPDDLPAVMGDPGRLRQVVTNLAANALKVTEEGEVRLSAEADGDEVVLRVTDTGPGIAADVLPLLFAEFGQVGGPRRLEGTGLGLAISKQLVELHGGSIEVDSAPGRGSVFSVRLPKAEADA